MYHLSVKGSHRKAEFSLFESAGTLTRLSLEVLDEDRRSDLLKVAIQDANSRANLEETWVLLSGTPLDIVRDIERELPVAKMEAEHILDYLDTVGDRDVTHIIYPLVDPSNTVMHMRIHQYLRKCQAPIVASMLNIKKEDVKVLFPS